MTPSAFNAVVVGFDGSSSSERALEWAAEEARRRSIRLHVIHVWQPPPILPTGFAVAGPPGALVGGVVGAGAGAYFGNKACRAACSISCARPSACT